MKVFRPIILSILCICLPWSATASALDSGHCRHQAGAARPEQPVVEMVMPEGMVMTEHCAHHPAPAAQPACDCAMKCSCNHHCASGGIASLVGGVLSLPAPDRPPSILGRLDDGAPRGRLLTDVFRPPNAALSPSAA